MVPPPDISKMPGRYPFMKHLLRVDLLSPSTEPLGKENLPPFDYVRRQVEALQSMSSLPILFTIRTLSQGGKFPDNAYDHAQLLYSTALRLGAEFVDLELTMPEEILREVSENRGFTPSPPFAFPPAT